MKSNGLKCLMGYLKKYRVSLFFVILSAVISTIFSVLAPTVMGGVTTALYDGVTKGEFDWELIAVLLAALLLLYLIAQIFAFLQNFGMSKITSRVMQSLRNDIDRKMHKTKLNYYDTRTNGEILSVITNDVDTVNNAISQNLTQIVTNLIMVIGILIMMLRINLWLALIAIISVPLSLAAAMGVMKASAKHYGDQQNLLGQLNGFIEEMYNGQSVIQTCNYQLRAGKRFDELNDALRKSSQSAEIASGTISPLTSLVNNAGYVVSAVLGCFFALSGMMTVGNVQAMLQYSKQFSQPFTSLAGMAGSFGAAMAAANRIFALLDAEEEIPDPEKGKQPKTSKGEVEFKHVAFGYTPDRLLMTDVNVTVKQGQKVAIVGPTGAGKTTLINLLMRFYEINSGEITVDGVNTAEMTRKELRNRFGMVLQDTWLFEGSIRDNLSYSRDGLTDEEILAASKAAGADGFIRTLPGAYDMVLTQGAENISQGERQLLTIARAMASDPEIMILDEATSNVDTHTEQKIQKAMAQLMKGRTSFVIAHRLSTIKDADVILYMENGDIKEVGSHEQLMELNGKYAALYNSQFV
ncbi:MAG: ABC transporter ATP-binding protein/permease [Lachnospiraceae bacterium]|nr:ABC transporter ATP-binding protein/permease [Ruminococcus sp.]MCM1276636.1 ABC transporter ATP-binding protein/permease [Lachnospiraceae bacterium]